MRHKPIALCVLAGIGAFLVGQGVKTWRGRQVAYVFGSDAASANPGGPAFAMQRAHELFNLYTKCNGDDMAIMNEVGLGGLRLPDQGSAEVPDNRASNTTAWAFPHNFPPFEDIAFYTDLYAKRNHTYFRDGKMNASPSGFLIVAMKNGDVRQVPVSEIRCMSYEGADYLVFPGVRGWRADLPYFPTFERVKEH